MTLVVKSFMETQKKKSSFNQMDVLKTGGTSYKCDHSVSNQGLRLVKVLPARQFFKLFSNYDLYILTERS